MGPVQVGYAVLLPGAGLRINAGEDSVSGDAAAAGAA